MEHKLCNEQIRLLITLATFFNAFGKILILVTSPTLSVPSL